jgi:hypothetical protein
MAESTEEAVSNVLCFSKVELLIRPRTVQWGYASQTSEMTRPASDAQAMPTRVDPWPSSWLPRGKGLGGGGPQYFDFFGSRFRTKRHACFASNPQCNATLHSLLADALIPLPCEHSLLLQIVSSG